MGKTNMGYTEIDLDNTNGDALADLENEIDSADVGEEKPAPKSNKKSLVSGQEGYVEIEDDSLEVEIIDSEDQREDGKKVAQEEKREEKKREQGPSRAQKRITKLAKQRKELEEQLAEERRKNKELESRYAQTRASSAKSQRALVSNRLRDLEYHLIQAAENNDWNKHAQITSEIADTNLRLRVLDYEANNVPPSRREEPKQQPQPQGIPEAAQDWLEDNPWMNDPAFREKRMVTERVADELIRRGMDPNDDSFYFELDTALEFIEQKMTEQRNSQEEVQEEEEREERHEAPRAQPAVSGRGRQAPRRPSSKVVRLTAEEKQMADDLGIPYDKYAREIQKYNNDGWTEL